VQFRGAGKIYSFDPGELALEQGTAVIVETAHGIEYGLVASPIKEEPEENIVTQLKPVVRIATDEDKRRVEDNKRRENEAMRICSSKIEEHKLDMKLVDVESAFDGSKLLFTFTSDNRVDFRELVKDLAGTFHTRIELRQIGVRDEARTLGGLGMCGRPLCCASFLSDFAPVSIKMAKEQGLSLNPTKISGTCGRLMCCLKYEQEAYEDLIATTPPVGSYVKTPDGNGFVTECLLVSQILKVKPENADDGTVRTYKAADVALIKRPDGRKGKKQPEKEDRTAQILLESVAVEPDNKPDFAAVVIKDTLLGESGKQPQKNAEKQSDFEGESKQNNNKNRRNNRYRKKNRNRNNGQSAPTGEKK